jgi:hypothetical protein
MKTTNPKNLMENIMIRSQALPVKVGFIGKLLSGKPDPHLDATNSKPTQPGHETFGDQIKSQLEKEITIP